MAAGRRAGSWRAMPNARDGAAVVSGVMALSTILASYTGRTLAVWAVSVVVLGGAGAVVTLLWSPFAAVALLAAVTSWAVTEELIEEMLDGSGRRRQHVAWLAALGVSALLFGTGLLVWPDTRSLGLVWPIGGYAVTCGTCALAMALRQRSDGTAASRTPSASVRRR